MKLFNFTILTIFLFLGLSQADDHETRYFNFLEQVYFENSNGSNSSFLRGELIFFEKKFPGSENEDQILTMLASLASAENDDIGVFLNYTKLVFLCPKSRLYDEVVAQIDTLLNKNQLFELTENKELILKQLSRKNIFSNHQEAYFEYLTYIYSLDLSCANNNLLFEIDLFREIYHGSDKYSDILLFWRGSLQENMGAYHAAVSSFKQIRAVNPNSDLLDEALFKQSRIQFRNLGNLAAAKDGFLELINAFSNSADAGNAQLCLAELYEDSLKNYNEALNNYHLFVEAFPEHPHIFSALKRIAYLSSLQQNEAEAIEAYMKIVEKYPEDEFAPTALERIALLYRDHFKNYERAANSHILFASTFQEHPRSAEHLYLAAKIFKNELNNEDQLNNICDMLMQHYPESSFAREAQTLLPTRNP